MTGTKAKVVGVNSNMVSIAFDGNVSMNEVGYVNVEGKRLKGEVIRIRGDGAQMQIYEMTNGIRSGDTVEFDGDLLCAELGPGLLGQVYDGLQNPLPLVAEQAGRLRRPSFQSDEVGFYAVGKSRRCRIPRRCRRLGSRRPLYA